MTKINAYSYKRKGKLVKVPSHDRRTYKGYRHLRRGKRVSASRGFKLDRKGHAKYRPRKRYKKHLSHEGDW